MSENNSRRNNTLDLATLTIGDIEVRTAGIGTLAAELLSKLTSKNQPSHLVGFLNPHVYNYALSNPGVLYFLRECNVVCIDGVGTVLAAKWLSHQQAERVVATMLFDKILDETIVPVRAILIGATAAEVAKAACNINARAKSLHVVAAYDGYREVDTYHSIFSTHWDIDVVLVGAGTPKSEHILLLAHELCAHALCWHIGGGTIGIYAGGKERAPSWLSRAGCEWMHRYVHEPHVRKRVIGGTFLFVQNVMQSVIRQRREEIRP